jgi:hypothetical protein
MKVTNAPYSAPPAIATAVTALATGLLVAIIAGSVCSVSIVVCVVYLCCFRKTTKVYIVAPQQANAADAAVATAKVLETA